MAPSGSSALPATTRYHRWLGWHAPALRRVLTIGLSGLIVILALLPFVPWELAIVAGWDVAAVAFLCTVWLIILRATGADVEHIAARRDEARPTATLLVVGASTASLVGVGFALGLAGRESDVIRGVLVIFAFCTVIVSWTVINTVFTLRYAHLHVRSQAQGIDFGPQATHEQPTYRDFAYVAFTVGMTYQVSDTALRDPKIRQAVLLHAFLAYLFGVVIVAGAINLVAGLIN